MATSGTNTFELDVADIIEEAYERLGIEVRTSYQAKSARRSLNLLLQDLSNRQINLWKIQETIIAMIQGTYEYVLDNTLLDVQVAILRRDSSDLRMERLARSTYETRPNKSTESRPSQFYVDRTIPPTLKIYPAPDNSTDEVVLQASARIEDVTASTETLDVPVRVQTSVIAGLTYYLSLKHRHDIAKDMKMIFEEELNRALEEDRERGSLYLYPQSRRV